MAEGSIDLTEVGGPDGGAVTVRAEGSAVAVSVPQAAPSETHPWRRVRWTSPPRRMPSPPTPSRRTWCRRADEGPEEEVGVLDRRDDLLAPAEKSLARTLKRLVSDEQNEVLDRLRRIKRGRPETRPRCLGGDEDVERFADALGSDFRVAAEAGLTFWGEQSGDPGSGRLSDPDALRVPLVGRVTELLEIRRAHVQKVLDDADAEGLEPAEIGDHIRAAYREWRSHSVGELAGDLATAGFAQGLRDAAGAGTPWCWVPDNGGLPCSDAEDNSLAGAGALRRRVPDRRRVPPGALRMPMHPGAGPSVTSPAVRYPSDMPRRPRKERRRDKTPRPNRGRIIVGVVIVLIVLLALSLRAIATFWTDFLWFDSVELGSRVAQAAVGQGHPGRRRPRWASSCCCGSTWSSPTGWRPSSARSVDRRTRSSSATGSSWPVASA